MVLLIISIVVPLLVSVLLLLLCTGKKKKRDVEVVKYSQTTRLNDLVDPEMGHLGNDSSNTQNHSILATNGNEARRSHSASQASRELPQPPASEDDSGNNHVFRSQRNSTDCVAGFASEASGDDSVETKHASPKGRRLPTPPPEGTLKSLNKEENDMQDDEDMYARVDNEQKKQEPVRLKIKTLDIKEGSGDSSFYAKVTDPTEEDTDLYAQVDDKGLEVVRECDENKDASVPSTSLGVPMYTTPEYASIDKLKKGLSVKKKTEATEPAAPPIPERNFDSEDDLADDNGDNEDGGTSQQNETETVKAPMYDKLCVRESLDHIRLRQEVEEERKQRYANLPRVSDDNSNAGDVYAQIDETNPEAVYESLSQPGSADGTFQPNNSASAGYSSIGELNLPNNTVTTHPDGDAQVDLQTRPEMQHHYEQIERPQVT